MSSSAPSGGLRQAARVIVVGSVMFSFISFWRTAAIVLCDLGSTAFYIGGIVEQIIGAAAPWFILAVMLYSYAVRSVYIESCSLFIRGGVYRVVKEALGRFLAKLAVSALIFDYLLTGPISGVSAGHYLMGLFFETLKRLDITRAEQFMVGGAAVSRSAIEAWGAVVICCLVTLYFYRINVRGIHESSDRALKIMVLTTIMVVVMLAWCGALRGRRRHGQEPDPAAARHDAQAAAHRGGQAAARPDARLPRRQRRGPAPAPEPRVAAQRLAQHLRRHRRRHRLRPLHPGHVRRGDAGPGLSRSRIAQAAELPPRRPHRLCL
jgi:hypothetical protein